MKKNRLLLLSLLPLLALSCGEDKQTQVSLRFGTLIDMASTDAVTHLSQIRWVKSSTLARLVNEEDNFVLLLHGSQDTCTCYTAWHDEILSRYAKSHKLLIYGVSLSDLEESGVYYDLQRIQGSDTLAIFENGKLKYQHTTAKSDDPWVTDYATFAKWMEQRTKDPVIFTVSEEILDGYYQKREGFAVYFGRATCGDCSYLSRTALRSYIDGHNITEPNFFFFDLDPYRVSRADCDSDEEYDQKMAIYQEKKDKYGLSVSEDNPAGYETGVFPTIFYVNPDGESFKGDVIEAAGVFYNEQITDGVISGAYFTQERYTAASSSYLGYLKESKVETKYYEGVTVGSETVKGDAKKDLLRPYEEPIINALLDYCVGQAE